MDPDSVANSTTKIDEISSKIDTRSNISTSRLEKAKPSPRFKQNIFEGLFIEEKAEELIQPKEQGLTI